MDAPAMFTRKQVPKDTGLHNTGAADEGGQAQLHREEKEHKPVLKKVKEKVKKIKHTLTGHSHGHGNGDEHGRASDDVSSGDEEEGDAPLEREAALEMGGYMEDVEDKPVASEPDPEVHGAPMYDSERKPAVQDLVAKYDPLAKAPAAREAHGADAPGVRFGDLGSGGAAGHGMFGQEAHGAPGARFGDFGSGAAGHGTFGQEAHGADAAGVHFGNLGGSGAAGHATFGQEARGSDAPGVRFGDLSSGAAGHGTFGQETRGSDAPGVRFGHDTFGQEARRADSPKVRLGDLGGPVVEDPAAPRSRQPAAREGEDIGATPVVREFESMTLSDDPSHVGAAKTGARAEEWKDAAADKLGGTGAAGGATYTEKLKSAAAVPAEYGRKLASTVYEKVAGSGGTPTAGAEKRDDELTESMPVSDAGAGREEFADAPAAVDATTDTTDRSSSGPGYVDKIKSTAAGTTEYGKQLASAAYEKVAAVAPSLRPQEKPEQEALRNEDRAVTPPSSDTVSTTEKRDAMLTDLSSTDNTAAAAPGGPGYTEKIKSAAAGTTEYGKQLATTVYEKVAGVGTAVAGKVQQATQSAGTATPGVGAQHDTTSATATPGAGGPGNGQDKGVGVMAYIADKLRPGDEDRALSEDISGAVQRRKEEVGGTVGQRVPAPSQVITKAREAVTSLTGGNRVSETVQPDAATGTEVRENVGTEAPMLRGEDIGERKLNTNTM